MDVVKWPNENREAMLSDQKSQSARDEDVILFGVLSYNQII